jgi:4-hydroxy-2-oxoheptanedioate aldolase
MDSLKKILLKLKEFNCSGIKISFEDEGALLNEIISMSNLTTSVGLELSIKIGGCEAKRDINDCIELNCESIVSPMVESKFALEKFLKSLDMYNYNKKKGFNLETINSYNNLEEIATLFSKLDFVTVGRFDFVSSINKDRDYVDSDEMYEFVKNIFKKAKEHNILCYLGGSVSINSKEFIKKLYEDNLIDKFETRYVIFNTHNLNFDNFNQLIYWGNVFEVEWLKFINTRYMSHANKDIARIKMIEQRIYKNNN